MIVTAKRNPGRGPLWWALVMAAERLWPAAMAAADPTLKTIAFWLFLFVALWSVGSLRSYLAELHNVPAEVS